MNKELLKKIYEKIKKFDTIYIVRHIGPDPDAVASQLALRDSIKLTFPKKNVYAIGASVSKFKFIGKLDKIEDNISYEDSLIITLDVPNISRVDGLSIDKFKNIIKIDHHPFIDKYADIEFIAWTNKFFGKDKIGNHNKYALFRLIVFYSHVLDRVQLKTILRNADEQGIIGNTYSMLILIAMPLLRLAKTIKHACMSR